MYFVCVIGTWLARSTSEHWKSMNERQRRRTERVGRSAYTLSLSLYQHHYIICNLWWLSTDCFHLEHFLSCKHDLFGDFFCRVCTWQTHVQFSCYCCQQKRHPLRIFLVFHVPYNCSPMFLWHALFSHVQESSSMHAINRTEITYLSALGPRIELCLVFCLRWQLLPQECSFTWFIFAVKPKPVSL